eukprot:jgi/Mesen1/1616/ME000135S00607
MSTFRCSRNLAFSSIFVPIQYKSRTSYRCSVDFHFYTQSSPCFLPYAGTLKEVNARGASSGGLQLQRATHSAALRSTRSLRSGSPFAGISTFSRGTRDQGRLGSREGTPRAASSGTASVDLAEMEDEVPLRNASGAQKQATFRVEEVGGHMTEFVEIRSKRPKFTVIVIPGNPGISPYYKDYVEALYADLEGRANVISVGHLGFSEKDWENGRLFSLQDQILHKQQCLQHIQNDQHIRSERHIPENDQHVRGEGDKELPVVLVGHSIGAFITLELMQRFPAQVHQMIGLYPFIRTNKQSRRQRFLARASRSRLLRAVLAAFAGVVGSLPGFLRLRAVGALFGRLWSRSAIDVTYRYLLQYGVVSNFSFMGSTEFDALDKEPNWDFMRAHSRRIGFIFGVDDHWGPLHHRDEMTHHVPDMETMVEREGHLHAFCCTLAGSQWVASQCARMISKMGL